MTQWGLDTLFNPSKRHMDEEKQRQQSTREEVGDSSGGKRIDFESGRVTISRTDDDAEGASDRSTKVTSSTSDTPAEEPELTPAQQRARDRRRRSAKK